MNPQPPPAQGPGLNLADIYYVLFRHKWKILLCSAAGIVGAVAMYKLEVPQYVSEAKLFVRYIVSENKARPSGNEGTTIMPDKTGNTIMDAEREILTSMDLAQAVVEVFGAEKILAKAGGGNDKNAAAALLRNGLSVTVASQSSVLHIILRHPDSTVVKPVLEALVAEYLKKHTEVHTSTGIIAEYLSRETELLRGFLKDTEDELRKALRKADVMSFDEAKQACSAQMTAIRREILNYRTEMAGRTGMLEEIKKQMPASLPVPAAEAEEPIPLEKIDEYSEIQQRIDIHKARIRELGLQYTADNIRVKEVKAQLAEEEKARKKIQEEYPAILRSKGPGATQNPTGPDLIATEAIQASMQITSIQAKINESNKQLEQLKLEAAKLDEIEGNIMELRRRKQLLETNYLSYSTSLQQSNINDQLGSGRVSNISEIQTASLPFRDFTSTKKLGMSAVGGILAGLAWAFLIEMFLDRSVRRPVDLERMLRAPLFLSVPRIKMNGNHRALKAAAKPLSLTGTTADSQATGAHASNGRSFSEVAEKGAHDPLQPFHETLRDRLIGYFENKNLVHKPKLVAVTGLGRDAGVTTTAAGLARSLSETGEGNVLLVDMTVSTGAAQQFVNGKPACGLDEILDSRDQAQVHNNLYVVSESTNSDRLSRNLPQRFAKLVPKLKATDFDYVIFDMPPVSQLSITPRLAGFMDMVLLVIESEKTDRDNVQKAASLLAEAKVHVGVVLNKTRSYVPARLHQEFLSGN